MHTDRQEGMGAEGGYSSQASHNRTTGMATMGMHLSSIAESSIRATLGAGVGVHPGGGMLAGAEAEAFSPPKIAVYSAFSELAWSPWRFSRFGDSDAFKGFDNYWQYCR